MYAELQKSIEVSLIQAQVFYISLRDKFYPCKSNATPSFSFYGQLYSTF